MSSDPNNLELEGKSTQEEMAQPEQNMFSTDPDILDIENGVPQEEILPTEQSSSDPDNLDLESGPPPKEITQSSEMSIDYKSELEIVKKKLAKAERQLEKANDYNSELRQELDKLSAELHKYRSATKNKKDIGTQVETNDCTPVTEVDVEEKTSGHTAEDAIVIQDHVDSVANETTPSESKSIADTLRETAEAAIAHQGYVFDEQTGLYYDYNSGYYYDAEKALYYDPRTGTYFYYDQQTGEYQFHSQVDLGYYTGHHHGNMDHTQDEPKPHIETPNVKKKTSRKRKEKPKESTELQDKEKVSDLRDHIQKKREEKQLKKRKDREKESEEKQFTKKKRKRKSRLDKWKEICQSKIDDISELEVNQGNMGNNPFSVSEDDSQSLDNSKPGCSKDGEIESNKKDVSMDDVYKDMPIFDDEMEDRSLEVKSLSSLTDQSNNAAIGVDKSVGQTTLKLVVSASGDYAVSGSDIVINGDSDNMVTDGDSTVIHADKMVTNGDNVEAMTVSSEYTTDSESESDSLCTGESELESGELTDSDADSGNSVIEVSDESENDGLVGNDEDLSRSWPPCIRVIVTDSDCLDIGSLYIITVNGSSIGREAQDILIPDISISKDHAYIGFDEEKKKYVIKDRGSQNGTFLNEQRISEPKCVSDLMELNHGDTLQFGCTRLLLHIHTGTDTCDDCEPGIIKANLEAQQPKEVVILSKEEKKKQYREQMKLIKQKYGLKNSAYVDNVAAIKNPAYSDKAGERRKTVGSDNPYQPNEAPSSVDRPISEKNVGHKMLKKLGWTEGKSLGKDNTGIQEPVKANIRANQAAGLGSSMGAQRSLDDVADIPKTQKWLQTQIRYLQTQSENKSKTKTSSSTVKFVQGPTQENS